jgi:hypothetical protein
VRLRSAGSAPVSGDDIRRGRADAYGNQIQAIDNWWLTFKYELPRGDSAEAAMLRRWDQTYAKKQEHTAYVSDVNNDGYLLFTSPNGSDQVPTCTYDHWKEFYNEQARYLAGQCSTMKVTVHADGKDFDGTHFFIGPPCKLYVYADPAEQELYGHAFPGLIDERGQNLRVGFFLSKPILG